VALYSSLEAYSERALKEQSSKRKEQSSKSKVQRAKFKVGIACGDAFVKCF
jgi:hypothetical protein